MLTQKQIQSIVDTIANGYKPEKIILFGSYANGTAKEDSDLDFLIVKRTKEVRYRRSREVHELFNPYPWAMDIIVATPKEYKKRKKIYGTLEHIVETQGKVLYEE